MKMKNPASETNNKELVDTLQRPMRDLRVSLTDRCNFNCNYCMPEKDVLFVERSEILSFEEIERVVRVAVSLGVEKVKLTGGEPTLRVGLDMLIKKLFLIEGLHDVGLITNGYFLKSIGHRLKEAGLKRISISLDALDNRVFQTIIGTDHGVHPVLEGIETAVSLGFSPIKINCVIQKGINEDQILPLVEYFRRPNFHLRFIEFMDVGSIVWEEHQVCTTKEIYDIINAEYPLQKKDASFYGEVAKRYEHKDGMGEIGFISSVTNPFCEDCTRLRLSANGSLYGCLFSNEGMDIKHLLRTEDNDEVLRDTIIQYWSKRDDRYSEERSSLRHTRVKQDMNFMGG